MSRKKRKLKHKDIVRILALLISMLLIFVGSFLVIRGIAINQTKTNEESEEENKSIGVNDIQSGIFDGVNINNNPTADPQWYQGINNPLSTPSTDESQLWIKIDTEGSSLIGLLDTNLAEFTSKYVVPSNAFEVKVYENESITYILDNKLFAVSGLNTTKLIEFPTEKRLVSYVYDPIESEVYLLTLNSDINEYSIEVLTARSITIQKNFKTTQPVTRLLWFSETQNVLYAQNDHDDCMSIDIENNTFENLPDCQTALPRQMSGDTYVSNFLNVSEVLLEGEISYIDDKFEISVVNNLEEGFLARDIYIIGENGYVYLEYEQSYNGLNWTSGTPTKLKYYNGEEVVGIYEPTENEVINIAYVKEDRVGIISRQLNQNGSSILEVLIEDPFDSFELQLEQCLNITCDYNEIDNFIDL